jgi:hypothetical protein
LRAKFETKKVGEKIKMEVRNLFYVLLVSIVSISTLSYAKEADQQPEKIIKLYPNTTGNFWSILRGSEIEILNKKSENNYSFWSFSGSLDDTNINSDTTIPITSDKKQDNTAYSLGVGYGNISYTSHKTWDSFNKNKIAVTSQHTDSKITSKSSNSATSISNRTYILTYSYSLGVEKKIIDQFSLGVEAEVFTASLSHNNHTIKNTSKDVSNVVTNESDTTQNRWKANTQVLGSFKAYAKIDF